MFREKEAANDVIDFEAKNATILKEDARFEGKLIFEGKVLVSGQLKGEIISDGELIVGHTGCIEGKIEIGTIVVHGTILGDITAKQKIVINAPAQVRGDITAPSLIIEEGAVFEGNCSMGKELVAVNNLRPTPTPQTQSENKPKYKNKENVLDMQTSLSEEPSLPLL